MKLYRYKYDKNRYYAGLVYPIADFKGNHIYPTNCTDIEPFWKDGYIARFDLTLNNWRLVPTNDRQKVFDVENEVLGAFTDQIDAKIDSIERKFIELQANHYAECQNILNEIKSIIENSDRLSKENFYMIDLKLENNIDQIDKINNNQLLTINEISVTRKYLSPIREFFKKLLLFFDRLSGI